MGLCGSKAQDDSPRAPQAPPEEPQWTCHVCFINNDASAVACAFCDTLKRDQRRFRGEHSTSSLGTIESAPPNSRPSEVDLEDIQFESGKLGPSLVQPVARTALCASHFVQGKRLIPANGPPHFR